MLLSASGVFYVMMNGTLFLSLYGDGTDFKGPFY